MTNLYFEELEIGTRSTAGPYLVSKEEIKPLRSDKLNRYNALWFDPGGRHEATGVHCAC
jgi:hypothetical protein